MALWPALVQASTQAGCWSRSTRCTHSVQPSTQPLPRGTSGFWSVSSSCTKRARLVRAGHHAIAAADADVPVDQHDAVGALERSAGGADVDAGRMLAMLAHHRQPNACGRCACPSIRPCVSTARRCADARVALIPFSVAQALTQSSQPGAHLLVSISRPQRTLRWHRLLGRARAGDLDQPDPRREHHPAQGGCGDGEKAAPAQASFASALMASLRRRASVWTRGS